MTIPRRELMVFLKARKQKPEVWAQVVAAGIIVLDSVIRMSGMSSYDGSMLFLGYGIFLGAILTNGALRSITRKQLIKVLESQIKRDPEALQELLRIQSAAEQTVQPDRREDAAPG